MSNRISALIVGLLIAAVALIARLEGGYVDNLLSFSGPRPAMVALAMIGAVVALAFGVYHLVRARPPAQTAQYWAVAVFALLVTAPFVGYVLLVLAGALGLFMAIPYAIALVGTVAWMRTLIGG